MGLWHNNHDQLCGISWGNALEKVVRVYIGNGDYVEANWKMVYLSLRRYFQNINNDPYQ